MENDALTGVGLVAAPGIIAALVGVFVTPLLSKIPGFTGDFIPPVVFVLAVGYAFAAAEYDIIATANPLVTLLIGINVALATVGVREVQRNYRGDA